MPYPKPIKKPKTKWRNIKPVAARKSSDVAKYNREVKRWKEGRLCACGCKKPCDDCHHMKGRVGYADIEKYYAGISLLHDKDFWLPVCRLFHIEIEKHPEWALSMGYSLSKTKNIYR